jgi:glycosyltransferase involved in cell wall biosynthesis
MKILQVIPYFDFAYGGQVTIALGLSKKLAEKEHEVYICTTDIKKNGGYLDDKRKIYFDCDKIKISYFKCSNSWFGNKLKLIFSPEMAKFIKGNLKNFDVVHIHEIRGFAPLYVWYYARKYNVPYILQAHGAAPIFYPNQNIFLSIMKLIFHNLLGRYILNNSSNFVASTDIEKGQYRALGIHSENISIISNAVDTKYYANLPKKGNFRIKYSIKPREKLILYLGQIHPIKGLELLINAFHELVDTHDHFKLVLVGPDSGDMLKLKRLSHDFNIDDRVLFTGPIYGLEKLEAYLDADVYVLPSIYESFPNTILESAACGLPTIITENCALSRIFKEKKLGLVVKRNIIDLQRGILLLLNNENLKFEFCTNARKWVFDECNWEEISSKYENIYRKVSNHDDG